MASPLHTIEQGDSRMADAMAAPPPAFMEAQTSRMEWPQQLPTIVADADVTQPQYSPMGVSELTHGRTGRVNTKMERSGIEPLALDHHDSSAAEEHHTSGARALEIKRLRNRECMRRSRQRKQDELNDMKTTIAQLEDKLRDLQLRKTQALLPAHEVHNSAAANAQRLVNKLQHENFALRDEIREKDKLREVLQPLLEQEEQRIILDEQQRVYEEQQPSEQFAWLRHVQPILALKSMTPAQVQALLLESSDQIMKIASHADTSIANPNRVFGWTDKRIVDDQYVNFMFSKDFAHQDIDEVATKSWETCRNLDKVDAFQPREQRMVCLQRWGDDAIVIARNLHVPQLSSDGRSELERNYCSVFLVFRFKTPCGYMVGTRTLAPTRVQEALQLAGEFRVTYVDLCYGLLFAPLDNTSPVGCNVRFGGRAGNGTTIYAQVCAMDVMLAILRWETYCIAPLNRLTSSASNAASSSTSTPAPTRR